MLVSVPCECRGTEWQWGNNSFVQKHDCSTAVAANAVHHYFARENNEQQCISSRRQLCWQWWKRPQYSNSTLAKITLQFQGSLLQPWTRRDYGLVWWWCQSFCKVMLIHYAASTPLKQCHAIMEAWTLMTVSRIISDTTMTMTHLP